ncbi:MAG TPA: hypothetical protein VFV38_42430 [Ktedonobacteraceae bacterium]|nr:hypothetical protein [Ktedonobacteraceae bacterium]
MYLRWKDGAVWLRVSLVRSVRRNGQPRQEILGSFSVRQDAEGRAALAWNMLEDQLADLPLAAGEREKARQLFAQRLPRPDDDELQARRRLSEQHEAQRQEVLCHYFGEDWQQRLAVVSSTPPPAGDVTLQEGEPCLVVWKVEPGAPKFHKPAVYTAFLARGALSKKRVKLGDIPAPALTGMMTTSEGKMVVSHPWQAFWYSAHHALVLAGIPVDGYRQVMRQLAHWVKRPTQEDMVLIVEDRLYWEQRMIDGRLRELDGAMRRLLSRREAQRTVFSRSPEYLDTEAIHPHWVR